MLGNPGTYANKKRKKPVLKQKKTPDGDGAVKSNPSKRHRDRLNGELERLTELLPFPEDVRSRLDKLSVLRLSAGYLRVKSYFRATTKNSSSFFKCPGVNGHNGTSADVPGFTEGDLLLQALNGFVTVVTSEGLVFYASRTITDYLGFHQSDVVHQSVFELIHTDDRAAFRQQLHFALNPPPVDADGLQSCGEAVLYSPEQLPPENSSFLERSFVCRFRCLLDNSSGFLALKFQGRLKYLHGQRALRDSGRRARPQLALFAIAVPVQAPSIVEIRSKMLLFQTKHKLDFTPMGIDSRGTIVLGYSEIELCMKGSGYQFIHAADMMHCAESHIRMIRTGESGPTIFRLLSKSGGWVWVQANARLIYKGGRPDFIIAQQRTLVNAEGEDHLRQRGLQLPFSLTTGEAILYDAGPTVDVAQFHFNQLFGGSDAADVDVAPGSLLDCFLKQDEAAYAPPGEPPSPVDQVFMDSRALLTFPGDARGGGGAAAGEQSAADTIGDPQKPPQSSDLAAALQSLEVGGGEPAAWDNTLRTVARGHVGPGGAGSQLDGAVTNDIFDYIEALLYKEAGEGRLSGGPPGCLMPPPPQPRVPPLPRPEHIYAPLNGHAVDSAQTLCHRGPLTPPAAGPLPPLQHLQLRDLFSPSMELPAPAANGQLLPPPRSGRQPNNILDAVPPLIPCGDFASSGNAPAPFAAACQHVAQNPFDLIPECHAPENRFPHAGHWPEGVARLSPAHQGGPALVFDQHCSSCPAGGDASRSRSRPHPQGSCCFQWSHAASADERLSTDLSGMFAAPAQDVSVFPQTL